MHLIDDDHIIRRNLVGTSFGIIVVSWLGLPLTQILSAAVPSVVIDIPMWKLIALAFAVLGYFCYRLETSSEGVAFHEGYKAIYVDVMLQLFVKDWNRLANKFAKGGKEHPYLTGQASMVLGEWIGPPRLDSFRVSQSEVIVRLDRGGNFPFMANLVIHGTMGTDDHRFGPGEEKHFKVLVTAEHRKWLRRRAKLHVHFRHPIGIQVIVPICICAFAYLCLAFRLAFSLGFCGSG